MRWAALVLLLATSCPAPPGDGALKCAANSAHQCPGGYNCIDGRCYVAGHVFDLAVPAELEDLAVVGDSATAPPDMVTRTDMAGGDLGLACRYQGYSAQKCNTGRTPMCDSAFEACGGGPGQPCCTAGGCWSDSSYCDINTVMCKACP